MKVHAVLVAYVCIQQEPQTTSYMGCCFIDWGGIHTTYDVLGCEQANNGEWLCVMWVFSLNLQAVRQGVLQLILPWVSNTRNGLRLWWVLAVCTHPLTRLRFLGNIVSVKIVPSHVLAEHPAQLSMMQTSCGILHTYMQVPQYSQVKHASHMSTVQVVWLHNLIINFQQV